MPKGQIAMKIPNYRLLLAGDGLAAFGSWIDFLAILTLAAYQFKVNAFEMGVVSAASLLPGILLAKQVGRLCDRENSRNVLQLSIACRFILTCAIIFSAGAGFHIFLALVAVRSIFTSVTPPAINVVAVRSISEEDRPRFYSALNVVNNTAKIIAPAVGTIASSLSSETLALGISAVFSVGAFVTFAFLGPTPAPQDERSTEPSQETRRSSALATFIYIAASYAFFVFMVNNLVPLALQRAGFDKSLLGLLISASGAGNIVSGLWLARTSGPRAPKLFNVVLPAVLQACGFLVIGLVLLHLRPLAPVLLCICFFIIGTFSARYAITCNVYLTSNYPSEIGATSSAIQAWQNAMILLAPLAGAFILERSSPGILFISAAAIGLCAFAASLAQERFFKAQPVGVSQ
jgi:predicted MFS family arabinose efflux permease